MHGFLEADGVQDADAVAVFTQERPALHGDAAFRVRDHERAGVLLRGALHEVWLQPVSCFAAAGATDDQDVFVPRRPGVLGPVVHRKALCLRQDDVVGKDGIDERRDVLRRTP